MHFTLVDVLMDFAKISMLLIAGSFLRRKIKLFQYYYIPVALIAGVLGLLLGKEVLGSVSPYYLGYSPAIRQFAGISSAIVFSCSFLGVKLAKMEKSAFQTYFLAGSIHQMQVIVGLTLAFIFAMFNSDFPVGFGIFPVLGFYGGHPIAIAAGTIFDDAGYMTTGSQVGATFSTIGLIIGVVAGMILINKAAAKGITAVAMRREDMPKSLLTGYYKPDERPEMCKQATFAPSLDPLASQVMLVGFVVCCGYIIRTDQDRQVLHPSAAVRMLPDFRRHLLPLHPEEPDDPGHDRPCHRHPYLRYQHRVHDRFFHRHHQHLRLHHLRCAHRRDECRHRPGHLLDGLQDGQEDALERWRV